MSQPSGNMGSSGSKDDRTLGMLAHVLGLLTCIVGPLVIWLLKKDSSAFVGDNAKEALNFQITMAIGYIASMFLWCIPIVGFVAFLVWAVLAVLDLVFSIMGAMAANKGELYRYPFAIRLIN